MSFSLFFDGWRNHRKIELKDIYDNRWRSETRISFEQRFFLFLSCKLSMLIPTIWILMVENGNRKRSLNMSKSRSIKWRKLTKNSKNRFSQHRNRSTLSSRQGFQEGRHKAFYFISLKIKKKSSDHIKHTFTSEKHTWELLSMHNAWEMGTSSTICAYDLSLENYSHSSSDYNLSAI